jgi:hypothetical protein
MFIAFYKILTIYIHMRVRETRLGATKFVPVYKGSEHTLEYRIQAKNT